MGEAKVGEEFITREYDEPIAVRTAATAFARAQKASCQVLADELAVFAARIATAKA